MKPKGDKFCVFDIEADGLNPSKIHCLTAAIYSEGEWRLKSTTDYDKMRDFFLSSDVLIGHNIARWDIPVVERLLEIEVSAHIVDTIAIAWVIEPDRPLYGLATYGEEFGIPKPLIEDWDNLSVEEYIHRCEEDVKANVELWDRQKSHLMDIYGSEDKYWSFLKYLEFKMDCAREAERSGWKIDIDFCRESLAKLVLAKEDKVEKLTQSMPKVEIVTVKNIPAKPYKQDGSVSSHGAKWFTLLSELGLPEDHLEPVSYISGYKEPNPNSPSQVKKWLVDLGWVPEAFDYVKKVDKLTGKEYTDKIPQIRITKKGEKVLCPSVSTLIEENPGVAELDGITMLSNRIPMLERFLKNCDEKGYIKAEMQGLTNTLRYRHKVVVNLPGVDKPYGEEVRGSLIAPEGFELCGSDMSSLEDRTKQHYMWNYDPDYVREMMVEDFDPHLNLAVFAGALTIEQSDSHKEYSRLGSEISKAEEKGDTSLVSELKELQSKETNYSGVRASYKAANYSCTYGAGAESLSRSLKVSVSEAKGIVDAYRKKNEAIGRIADDCRVKTVRGQKWLYNPVSKFWYSLRHDKDRFSTLNQGTGVFCFDLWIKEFRKRRSQLTGQMHDEVILCIKKGNREICEKMLREAIDSVNKKLNLNRDLDISVQFGDRYSQIH